jgi:hypothetical protein
MAERLESRSDPADWVRSIWLAEKVASGEMPAAATELTRQCDGLFVGQDRLEDHARILAASLASPGEDQTTRAQRSGDVLAYLQRLLALRELWVRERA